MAKRASARGIRKDVPGILRAPRRMLVADAVSKFMRVPMGAGNSVPWDPNLAPYVLEPMNCLASREYDAVVFVGPARTGKTIGLIDGWVVYNVVCDPSDMLIIQMTEEKAREHSKKRLDRTFRCSPEVATRLSPRRNDNNVYDRTFRAGIGNILLDVANKALLQGWDEAAETFELWTKKGQLSDFKTAHRVGMGGFPSLRQVREGAKYKYITTQDKGETIALATYGEIFSITRQAIINDDLNQLTDVPMKMGRAAKATIGDLVYAVLTGNGKLSDGKALFHADHANLSAGAISVDSLDKARQNMRKQKEGERALNIRPAYMLVPVGLETLASQTIKSASVKGADINAGVVNPLQNFAEVIAEARLDDADPAAWYLAAAQGTDTIEVAYLNGIDAPYIDQQEGFTTDGVATKVRIDAGVAPLDYRGLAKSSGK